MRNILILLFISSLLSNSQAQTISTEGKEFWFAFAENGGLSVPQLSVQLSGRKATTGMLTTSDGLFTYPFTITPGTTTIISIPATSAHVTSRHVKEKKAVHIVANDSIFAFASNFDIASSDAALLLPLASLRNEYYVLSYSSSISSNKCEFVIVATEDNTQINIVPSKRMENGVDSGIIFPLTLNKGEVYQAKAAGSRDLTGTHIYGADPCKPFAVIGANECTFIPNGFNTCDHIYEMMIPTFAWGKEYFVDHLKTRARSVYRFVSATDNNLITINNLIGEKNIVLHKGQFHEEYLVTASLVTSTAPISLALYSPGDQFDGSDDNGDPFMIILLPTEQSIDNVTFSALAGNNTRHYTNIVTDSATYKSVTVNGVNISGKFRKFTLEPRIYFAQHDLGNTSAAFDVNIKANGGFNAIAYGFGLDDSYGYGAGGAISNLTAKIIVDTPACAGADVKFKATNKDTIVEYLWDFGDGSTSTDSTPTHVYASTGMYKIKLGMKSAVCANFDYVFLDLRITEAPAAPQITGVTSACNGQNFSLGTPSRNDIIGYRWSDKAGTGTILSTDSLLKINNISSTTTYYLQLELVGGCFTKWASHQVKLEQGEVLVAPIVVCSEPFTGEFIFIWTGITGADFYEYSIDGGVTFQPTDNSGKNLLVEISANSQPNFRARAVSSGSQCAVGAMSEEVICQENALEFPKLKLPDAFTPNGDGINDEFGFGNLELGVFKMSIYNRWGEEIFKTDYTQSNRNWNGKYKNIGEDLPDGLYVYIASYTHFTGFEQLSGSVRLIR